MAPMDLWENQPSFRSLYALCIEPVCQRHGVNRTEFDILLFLANNPRYDTAAAISDVRHLAKSHVSVSLRSLERQGYIVRLPVENDRRQVHLRLTAKATAVVRAGRERQRAFAEIILDGLSEEERELLRGCFTRMERNIMTYLEAHAK